MYYDEDLRTYLPTEQEIEDAYWEENGWVYDEEEDEMVMSDEYKEYLGIIEKPVIDRKVNIDDLPF